MFKSYENFWRNFFNFEGTSSKGDFWWSVLINSLLFLFLRIVCNIFIDPAIVNILLSILCLPIIFGTLTCSVRRLREAGYLWFNLFLLLIPLFGWIILCVFLSRSKGARCQRKDHVWAWQKENCKDICSRCGETQEHHSFNGCKCTVCGTIQNKNHQFKKYIRENCIEVCELCETTRPRHNWNHCICTICGKKRDEQHDFKRIDGTCLEKCSICGKERSTAHHFNIHGICTICGIKDPNPFTLQTLTNDEIISVKFACEIISKLNNFRDNNKKIFTDLGSNLSRNRKLNSEEFASILFATSKVSQALSSDSNTMNFSNNTLNALSNRLHLVNLFSVSEKLREMLKTIHKTTETEKKNAIFIKKPLTEFTNYDESYKGYVKGGVCDVCNSPLDGKKAYAVDNKTFYDSPEYYSYLCDFQKKIFGIEMSRSEYEQRRKNDTSPGSAVCEDCIHMFADVSNCKLIEQSSDSEKKYYESDNLGSRHDTVSHAMGYWLGERMNKKIKPPFTMYTMPSYESGESALLELPFFHKAADSGKLICDRLMTFGLYEITEYGKPTGKYETLVSGSDLTLDEFHAAESAFEKHGGTRKNRQEPDKNIKPVRVEDGDTSKVNYKEKINDNNSIYEVYAAEKKADALAFLKFKSVHKPNFYIVVDTPEGNIGRDINGIYEE